jgi:deoxyribonuclease V
MNFKNINSWNLEPKQAIELQNELRKKITPGLFTKIGKLYFRKTRIDLIAGADVSFKKGKAIGIVAVLSFPELKLIESIKRIAKINYPYIPGLLTFREGPVLEECFKKLKSNPDIIIFDGQGIAHPRNMGIATHMGILLDKPTIGCAKTWLYGDFRVPKESRGSFSYLLEHKKRKIGVVLRTKDDVKAVFVSPGNKIDIKSSIKIILKCTKEYRLPEPLRLAHRLSKDINFS